MKHTLPAVAEGPGSFGNRNSLVVQPADKHVQIIDNECGVGVAGALDRDIHQHVTRLVRNPVINKMDANPAVVDESTRLAVGRFLAGICALRSATVLKFDIQPR